MNDNDIFTQAVHAGERQPPPDGQPISTPIYPAATFTYPDIQRLSDVLGGERAGHVYARYGSPTVGALEKAVAVLEDAGDAVGCASGMAALHLALVQPGVAQNTPVVAASDLYGATHTLLAQLKPALRSVDMTNVAAVQQVIHEMQPRVVLLEVMSNPLLKIADLPAIAVAARAAGAAVIVDSTFTTPYLIQPLKHGADVVVHSATKYLGGHGDVLAGVVATDAKRATAMRDLVKAYGGNLGAFEAWTVLRGIKTLPLRMRQHCANALQVARWLSRHPRVARAWYPGLPDHPQHDLARRLFRAESYGGVVAFELRGAGQTEVFRFMEALKLIQTGTSLGDVYSLMLYPAISSHRALSREERYRVGITDGALRLSVGIEDVEDIIADLEQALDHAQA